MLINEENRKNFKHNLSFEERIYPKKMQNDGYVRTNKADKENDIIIKEKDCMMKDIKEIIKESNLREVADGDALVNIAVDEVANWYVDYKDCIAGDEFKFLIFTAFDNLKKGNASGMKKTHKPKCGTRLVCPFTKQVCERMSRLLLKYLQIIR